MPYSTADRLALFMLNAVRRLVRYCCGTPGNTHYELDHEAELSYHNHRKGLQIAENVIYIPFVFNCNLSVRSFGE